ncbi:zinc finger BED domain-containing protein 5-like [Mixophyes fleayi]|uniref:zinc finger BED domain-containing protein 5-like n=1 Tax=Mixophyes fleayi TaxID=3061075 RepID=UPI003F4DC4F2
MDSFNKKIEQFVRSVVKALCRTSSVQRHFQTKHEVRYPNRDDRMEANRKAVSGYRKQSNAFNRLTVTKNQATESSYKIAQCIAKKGKPFTDGEYIKEAFIKVSEILFSDLSNKDTILSRIKDIPSSGRTIERRVTEMAENIKLKQETALKETSVFSVALDESVDVNGIARLAIVARYCDNENIYEELCTLKPLQGTTKGEDIASAFINFFDEKGIDLNKIFSVTTDGAPAMVGKNKGFVKLLEDHIGRSTVKFHCMIHQESLCAKMSNSELNSVMDTVVKIVNFIIARSSLPHRQFKLLLEELDNAYKDIPLHSNVRWLSRGKVLNRFVSCIEEIKTFMIEKDQNFPEPTDSEWLCKLMFLTDITSQLNDLNLRLQGAGQTVLDLYECWKTFTEKLKVFLRDIFSETYRYFPNVKQLSTPSKMMVSKMHNYMDGLIKEFLERCQDFQKYGPMFSFLIKPDFFDVDLLDLNIFDWMGLDDFEMQLIELKKVQIYG